MGEDVPCGSYKIAVHYSNATKSDVHLNMFLVRSGLEINFAYYTVTNSESMNLYTIVKNNGAYQLFNTYNIENEELKNTVLPSLSAAKSTSSYIFFCTWK